MLPTRLLLESTVSFIRTRILVPAGTVTILPWAQADPVMATQRHSKRPTATRRPKSFTPFIMISLLNFPEGTAVAVRRRLLIRLVSRQNRSGLKTGDVFHLIFDFDEPRRRRCRQGRFYGLEIFLLQLHPLRLNPERLVQQLLSLFVRDRLVVCGILLDELGFGAIELGTLRVVFLVNRPEYFGVAVAELHDLFDDRLSLAIDVGLKQFHVGLDVEVPVTHRSILGTRGANHQKRPCKECDEHTCPYFFSHDVPPFAWR